MTRRFLGAHSRRRSRHLVTHAENGLHLHVVRYSGVLGALLGACAGSRSAPPLTSADVHTDKLAADCNGGDLGACESLGEIYLQIEPPDFRRAETALRSACESLARSCETLAQLFAEQGRNQDASLMRQRACALGAKGSCPAKVEPTAPSPELSQRAPAVRGTTAAVLPEPTPTPDKQLWVGRGTCFAVSADGMIATADHVIAGVDVLSVQFEDEPYIRAKIMRRSSATDLALIKVERRTKSFISASSRASSSLGLKVFTIGFPVPDTLGFEPKFASGAVAAITVHGEDHLLQVQIPAYPGNSGGALVSEDGRLVGVIVSRPSDSQLYERTGSVAQEITYAVKANYLAAMINSSNLPAPLAREKAIELDRKATCKVLTLTVE